MCDEKKPKRIPYGINVEKGNEHLFNEKRRKHYLLGNFFKKKRK